jgi:hypothetical protein
MRHVLFSPRLTRGASFAVAFTLLAACDRTQPTELSVPTHASVAKNGKNDGGVSASVVPTVLVGGLNNPRGLAFGPDGAIYVAESGLGGTTSTVGQCLQVPAPGGPLLSGNTGRISRIDGGVRTTVIGNLPSSIDQRGGVLGVMDVAFVGKKLYALLNAGCGHGVPNVPASVIRVDGGSYSVQANLTAFVHANPVAHPEPADFEPDGDWYSLVAQGGMLYAVDANGGQVVTVQPNSGRIDRIIDVSAVVGHIVPTAIADGNGRFFLGNLTTFPSVPGSGKIFELGRSGSFTEILTGFAPVLGVVADKHDNLYVLETFSCLPQLPCVPAPFSAGTGRIVRIDKNDRSREVIATGLTFPTSMRLGPDGALYVSNKGYNLPPASGEVLRIPIE